MTLNTCSTFLHMNWYEYAVIFGANWLSSELKPSRQLVWENGDACLIPFTKLLLVSATQSFSYATEPKKNHKNIITI